MLVTKEQISLLKLYQDVSAKDIADVLVEIERKGKNIVLTPEIAALLSMDNAGRLRPIINTSGEMTEASAVANAVSNASASSNLGKMFNLTYSGNTWLFSADGAPLGNAINYPAFPGIPVAITADGTGAVAVAVEVLAAHATLKWDSEWTVQVSVSGLHQLDFIETTAGAAVTVPDYHSAPPDVFLVAGYPYTFRLMNVNANQNLGVNAGAAGYFPNNSVMTITPMSRAV